MNEFEPNSVVEGKLRGGRIIKKRDGYYIDETPLFGEGFVSIEKLSEDNKIYSSVLNKAKSIIKTGFGALTLTLPLYADSAKQDAERVMTFAKVTWADGDFSILLMQEEILKKITGKRDIFDAVLDKAKLLQDMGKDLTNDTRRRNPFSEVEYKNPAFHRSDVIRVIDGTALANDTRFDGAIGCKEKVNKIEIMSVYDSFAGQSGLKFTPSLQCGAMYYLNPYKKDQYIMVDKLFEEVQNERAAELEQVAFALGAKYFRVEMIDNTSVTTKKSARSSSKAKVTEYIKAESDVSYDQDSLSKEGHYILAETHFSSERKPFAPQLEWFAENKKIQSLINMRLSDGGDKIVSHNIEIRCMNYSIMNSETAGNIDAAIKKIGVKATANLKKHCERERNQTLLFHVEF